MYSNLIDTTNQATSDSGNTAHCGDVDVLEREIETWGLWQAGDVAQGKLLRAVPNHRSYLQAPHLEDADIFKLAAIVQTKIHLNPGTSCTIWIKPLKRQGYGMCTEHTSMLGWAGAWGGRTGGALVTVMSVNEMLSK